MAGKTKSSKTTQSSTSPSKKTVGVYDRPPQKRSRKPLLVALVIALVMLLIFSLVRLSQGFETENLWGKGLAAAVSKGDKYSLLEPVGLSGTSHR
jgi:uncharacterized membrane protein YvbJ